MTLSVPLLTLASMPSVFRWAGVQQSPGYHDWPMGPGMMSPWGMGWMGMFFMLVFWILVIVGLFLLIRWLLQATAGKRQEQREPRSVEILKERYARGEIDKEEFEQKRKDLE
jgi:putative membrane protein